MQYIVATHESKVFRQDERLLFDPAVSPDGREVVFSGEVNGLLRLYKLREGGQEAKPFLENLFTGSHLSATTWRSSGLAFRKSMYNY